MGIPKDLRVGDTVMWVNKDMMPHTATARDKSFNVELGAEEIGRAVMKTAPTTPEITSGQIIRPRRSLARPCLREAAPRFW